MKEYIYYLICPIEKTVKYVGKSKYPKTRYNQHLKKLDIQLTPKRKWLELLISQNKKPILKIVEEVEIGARDLEQKHVEINKKTILNIHNPAKGIKSNKWTK